MSINKKDNPAIVDAVQKVMREMKAEEESLTTKEFYLTHGAFIDIPGKRREWCCGHMRGFRMGQLLDQYDIDKISFGLEFDRPSNLELDFDRAGHLRTDVKPCFTTKPDNYHLVLEMESHATYQGLPSDMECVHVNIPAVDRIVERVDPGVRVCLLEDLVETINRVRGRLDQMSGQLKQNYGF